VRRWPLGDDPRAHHPCLRLRTSAAVAERL